MTASPDHRIRRVPHKPRLRIAVLGYIVRGPLGGLVWHHLQYVLGLVRMGHDVLYVEDSDDYRSCVHVRDGAVDADPGEGLAFAADAFGRFGLGGRFAYFDAHTNRWLGPARESAEPFCRSADLVLNVSGMNPPREWWARAPVRAWIDTDPAFVQIRNIRNGSAGRLAEIHNAFFSFGENIGRSDCGIPDDGLPWRPTRQPVVTEVWEASPPPDGAPLTTVMQWDSYPPLRYGGRLYGMKSTSFEPFLDLPRRAAMPMLLGVGGSSKHSQRRLNDHGWQVANTLDLARTPWEYRRLIRDSAGEFSVAKHGYVVSRSGWFSERSGNYLASGRAVVVQNTGFSDFLPTGRGLLSFSTPDEAVDAIARVGREPRAHGIAARRIAEEYFEASTVLGRLLEDASTRAEPIFGAGEGDGR